MIMPMMLLGLVRVFGQKAKRVQPKEELVVLITRQATQESLDELQAAVAAYGGTLRFKQLNFADDGSLTAIHPVLSYEEAVLERRFDFSNPAARPVYFNFNHTLGMNFTADLETDLIDAVLNNFDQITLFTAGVAPTKTGLKNLRPNVAKAEVLSRK